MPEQEKHHISQQELLPSSSAPSPHSGASSIAISLDELAKGLASLTLSRGKAIRSGWRPPGAALASLPGVALAPMTIAGVWGGNAVGTPSAARGTA